jgi:hypothetical protein
MIEFQYFDGCPNSKETLKNLMELKNEFKIPDSSIMVIEVPDIDSAIKYKFQGSPTILINGVDIYSGKKPEGYNYTCRIYDFEGKRSGVIPKNFIKWKMESYLAR